MKRLFATLAFAASLTLLSVSSYGQIPIASLPYTINSGGNYYLTQNLTYSGANGDAIDVNASNVTIDLNGYELVCSNSNTVTRGIFAGNVSNVSIKNGAIAGFRFGIELIPEGGSNVNFGHLVDGVRFINDYEAVVFYMTNGCVVRNCQIEGGSMASYSITDQEIALVTT